MLNYSLAKILALAAACMLALSFTAAGQAVSLTARQMNIYFGQPKRIAVTNNMGTVLTEFDRNGRILFVEQGNMKMVYDWSADNKTVTMSMYNADNFMDSGTVSIAEMTNEKYVYNVGDASEISTTFKGNGAVDKTVMITPAGVNSMTFIYESENDMFPYEIAITTGDQNMVAPVTVDKTDSHGNLLEYTQEFMGNKVVTCQLIEYY